MVSNDLGLRFRERRAGLEGFGDTAMVVASGGTDQGTVGRILDERVAEHERAGPGSRHHHEPLPPQREDRIVKNLLRQPGHGMEQLEIELASDHCRQLDDGPFIVRQAVEPGGERSAQTVGDDRVDQPAFRGRAGEFFHKERNAVGAGDDVVKQALGVRGGNAGDELADLGPIEAAQVDQRRAGLLEPLGGPARPVRDDDHQRQGSGAFGGGGEQVVGRRVEPVGVLDDEEGRRLAGVGGKAIEKHVEGAFAEPLRGDRRHGVVLAFRDRQQIGEQPEGCAVTGLRSGYGP